MPTRYPPVVARQPHMLHGGDYNPDQWLAEPAVIDQDFRLMKLAGVNIASVGIFAWSQLEPEEGRYTFDWLDDILDRFADAGGVVALATPSAARPPWLATKYRETSRVTYQGLREPYAGRHNHCYSSPVMREKIAAINERLAQRYADHPALGLWHISNEYGGECFCEHCLAAWRDWLARRYGTIEALNDAWWTAFWSHRYNDWAEVWPRDGAIEGEKLDWSRFVTDRTIDFMNHEIAAVRRHTPHTPVTTNFMGAFGMLDYRRFAEHLDVIANDWYPAYNTGADLAAQAAGHAFTHDLMRGMKGGRPWLLLESTPSTTNWQPTAKLKRPGQHRLESLQAVAHGADSVMYFQWRKGAGGTEKFHGAVVDHDAGEHTRVFADVAEVGRTLASLDELVGTTTPAQVALIYDWQSNWALEKSQGLGNQRKRYEPTCRQFHRALWKRNLPVDVIGSDAPFDSRRLLLAPMLHMIEPGVGERLAAFVEAGGTLVMTYLSGLVDEHGRCFGGGWPGAGLGRLAGVRVEEQDILYQTDEQAIHVAGEPLPGLTGRFRVNDYADLMHLEGARAIASYSGEFYADTPAVTMHAVGAGRVVYIGARTEDAFVEKLIGGLCDELSIACPVAAEAPEGVSIQHRTDGEQTFAFVLNFTNAPQAVQLEEDGWQDAVEGGKAEAAFTLAPLESRVLRQAR